MNVSRDASKLDGTGKEGLIKICQAAKIAKVTPETIKVWLRECRFKYYLIPTGSPKHKRVTRIRLSDFLNYLKEKNEPEAPPRSPSASLPRRPR